jgi:hypothetical protein
MKFNNPKMLALAIVAAAATTVFTGPASATLGQLLGDWKNVNSNTRDIVRIMVTEVGRRGRGPCVGRMQPDAVRLGDSQGNSLRT